MSELADHNATEPSDSFSVLERQKSVAETHGIPVAVLLELTHRCPLQCPYCSNPVQLDRGSTELTSEEWKKVLSELAEIGVLQVHFSGGEPTARKDIVELVRHANAAGLYTNLITSAVLLTREKLSDLADAGLCHVQISFQGNEPVVADRVAGLKDSHRKKIEVAKWTRELDLPLTVNAVMHRQNLHQLADIIQMAVDLDARLADPCRRNGDRAVNVVPNVAMTENTMSAYSVGKGVPLNNAAELEAALRHIGATRYHSLHPFHRLLHGGKLNKGQVQAWALNRYYYQSTIPIKDAVVISRFRDRGIRMEWRHRIEDHDGDAGSEGGIERWLKLTEGLGLDSAYVESTEGILPATRFAVEAYVHFVRDRSPLEAIASSLTELFAPNLHEERISGMLKHYDFVNPDIMSYFSRRLQQAPRDAGFALDYVREHATTPEQREQVCNALIFKTSVLWVQLDALYHAYVDGHIPPGAFVPKG